ncbi:MULTISPECIES: hypothetical protein [Edwardsiella]|uniref:Uncharacterized protein n=2 Tax=Edwardsiella anguillarum TaxID=1821960 RepID=A0A076LJP3_9GAMM|nr:MULTISPECIES: hypothetical protein [Edwardsiella]AIJ07022.1 Hypothetical protein ETEE_0548 [Edwardsiella anguillarum ET080813]AKR78430.1 hypothetical protein AAZ33_13085 [Edwardsiella sp. LADL05-105]KAB0586261.1 hypothetical protein F7P84_19050 [Edwardsiella anguillarum]UOU78173.1 hypothetical protein MUN71_14040 [Edwardsiella anguillarum]WHP82939.1 hypothetical protein MQ095_14180 [Edwardsiella anguillarum]
MSYSTVVSVWPGEKSEELEELQNAYGSGPVIWNDMAVRYLGMARNSYTWEIDKVWPLPKRMDIPEHNRAVLAMTYDNMIVVREDYARAAQCIRQYLIDFPADERYVNHWPRIAEIFESNPESPAIGLWLTSVCENPFTGEWNEDADEYDQPDWSKYWNVFEWLDAGTSKGE